ncbi:deleted in autism protein 1 [Lingula anatina]|uniref:Deleted in autism protein 1 n=1 Tax=Lingula anatina TaxID=7574 RepID=A0A1S3IVM6_LINAN|nr:deleted in autism protein 1 [Lingula anatina]|eukprot:XP_013402245.1 deleted in autism protein 1 [Lingula anatina]
MTRCNKIKTLLLRRKCRSASLLILLILAAYSVYYLCSDHLSTAAFLELHKCPACYGVSYCDHLLEKRVIPKSWSGTGLSNLINVKNVFFARHSHRWVVLKKLGHDKELTTLDRKLCSLANKTTSSCEVNKLHLEPLFTTHLRSKKFLLELVTGISDLTRCPSKRLVDLILNRYSERYLVGQDVQKRWTPERIMVLLTTLAANPEPVIMQVFHQDNGWPFPRYYGACGRMVVEQYVGKSLGDYYVSPWRTRVGLAYQLFQIADLLTNNKGNWSLYWTDVSYDNIAVDPDGRVVVVDLENIIVVDKLKIIQDRPPEWDKVLTSTFDECIPNHNCLSFSPDSLCTRLVADHNYYAVCHGILSSYADDEGRPGGLLHSMPDIIKTTWGLDKLLDECAKPSSEQTSRLKIKDQLLTVLAELAGVNG